MIDLDAFASWVSEEAQAALRAPPPGPAPGADVPALRAHYDAFNRRMLAAALEAYPVDIEEKWIGGVRVHAVSPRGGIRDRRLLVCLHGGAFMWGSGAGALLEAVPLAGAMGCEVLAVDYRLAPEHPYPAAVDDVLAVLTTLGADRDPAGIGLYGCSAGGVLTAQVIAGMARDGLRMPGAIAMLHGTGLDFSGDLAATAALFARQETAGPVPSAADLPYFATADLADPVVLPGNHPAVLAKFPPSLLVSATRDFAASACSVMHRRLLAASTDSRFVLFDGLGHAHHMDVRLPESQETFALLAAFFGEHLR